MFRNVMFVWQSMPIFSFTGYILTESFRKPDNWRRIYNQTSSTFFTSNMCLKRVEKKQLLGRHNNYICRITVCLITFKKYRSSHWICSIKKQLLENKQIQIHRKTPMLESLFNSKYKSLEAPILKNICERLLLKMCSWNWQKKDCSSAIFIFILKKQVKIFVFISWLVFVGVCIMWNGIRVKYINLQNIY